MPQHTGSQYISPLPPDDFQVPRKLVILGSTGSIGQSALQVLTEHPKQFQILGLAAGRNARLLVSQALTWRPPLLAVLNQDVAARLAGMLPQDYCPEIVHGREGYERLACLPEAEMVLSAQVGAAGLPATLAAARAGKIIALANKESLVLAGRMFRDICARTGAAILPVDSEHNAVFQALHGEQARDLRRIILTASGGPFRDLSEQELAIVTVKQTLSHPNWSMGAKISVDSATLMNKGLEVIEACHLFGLSLEDVDVVIHPQSLIHSLVEFIDRSLLAHLGPPDMRVPISHCLGYPHRMALSLAPLNLLQTASLTFAAPRSTLFPCLDLAKQAFLAGQSHCVVLNAANEAAVELFLQEKIRYLEVANLIQKALDRHSGHAVDDLEAILELSARTRAYVQSMANP
ncbi:MAG TPA: 1-deoxy-D-xylulose-5-phosphate reductoisomerase [Desulfonatronum sp.]|nr:1-deoxy-D-xylulose-5-phosphate reductoisomerase [Desulfonatronum sp.]